MGGPTHLWAGDWEQDSEEAVRARGGLPYGAETETSVDSGAATEPGPRARATSDPHRPAATWSRTAAAPSLDARGTPSGEPGARRASAQNRRRRLSSSARRVTVILAALLLIVVAGALGVSTLIGPSRSTATPSPTQPAWLGVQMGVLPAGAVVLTGVDSGGPAARAGLHTGDVITQIEGRPVAAPIDVTEAVAALRVGDTVEIQALRGSRTLVVRPRLTAQGAGSP